MIHMIYGLMPHLPPIPASLGKGAKIPDRTPEAEAVRLREQRRRYGSSPRATIDAPLPPPRGNLTPVPGSAYPGVKGASWLFECVCGARVRVGLYDYTRGNKQSCGAPACKRRRA